MSTENNACPRSEYPRPQFYRKDWINLNGLWDFAVDQARNGLEREFYKAIWPKKKILVPFCPESELSGIKETDFLGSVWYRRTVDIPSAWKDGRVLLHFGAVDYHAIVWVNEQRIGEHSGGYTPFCFDITEHIRDGHAVIAVYAEDETRTGRQPSGKQSDNLSSYSCMYTRTTGIWQTVWLEYVPSLYIRSCHLTPCVDAASVTIQLTFNRPAAGAQLSVSASFAGRPMGGTDLTVHGRSVSFTVPLRERHLWDVGQGNLYDLRLVLSCDGQTDTAESYFGLRSIDWNGQALFINGRPVFQRLVLDQGFYPDGIYTAPSAKALKRDIELGLAMGFNGIRAHEKLFEPLYLYYADRAGFLVWGEYANWGLDISTPQGLETFLPEWLEAVERDYNHPSVIGWCPFNETWDRARHAQDDAVLATVYRTTKALDLTRPVIDTSGNFHVITDIYDIHYYEQDPAVFAAVFEPLRQGGEPLNHYPDRQTYHDGEPCFVSEYGGIWWDTSDSGGWGYGSRPKNAEEFLDRYQKLTDTLLSNPHICAFCYTQLYDVEQEVNGLYTYDRKPKFAPETICAINTRPAAIELAEQPL